MQPYTLNPSMQQKPLRAPSHMKSCYACSNHSVELMFREDGTQNLMPTLGTPQQHPEAVSCSDCTENTVTSQHSIPRLLFGLEHAPTSGMRFEKALVLCFLTSQMSQWFKKQGLLKASTTQGCTLQATHLGDCFPHCLEVQHISQGCPRHGKYGTPLYCGSSVKVPYDLGDRAEHRNAGAEELHNTQ